ncbi:MAG: ATP-binding protein [Vicinamibacterales bacterium]
MAVTMRMVPSAPKTLDDTGLPHEMVYQIVAKTLHVTGAQTGMELASKLGVSFAVIEPCIDILKRDRHLEIAGGSMAPQSYVYRLTESGHARAADFSDHNQYIGRLPVPLAQYVSYLQAFHRAAAPHVTRQTVRDAFRHMVLSDRVLDQLGPALASRHSLFIYGPPGNGKTRIAQALGALLPGEIAIPHAIAVERDIVRVFDPMNHTLIADDSVDDGGLRRLSVEVTHDQRWVRCQRPVITVGGELTMESLELGFMPGTGFYRAPLQTLANGGLLIIDDFGRQRVSPGELLNRWIVPLESRVDHLVLQSGQKFEMPFETLIVFATNLNPLDLLDESFLRRIRYKVYAESPTREDFISIFMRCCEERELPCDRQVVEDLIRNELEPRHIQLRGCQPRDLIEHALSLAAYVELPGQLSPELLSAACATYFLGDDTPVDHR